MRPVNLLPARYQPARASGSRSGVAYIAVGALAVVLLMVLAYVLTQNGINDAKDKTAQANAEKAEADAKIGSLQAYGNFAQLKVSRETAVRSLAQVRFDWERLMREVSLVLPKNVYLTTFSASSTGEGAAAAPTEPTSTTGTATATGPVIQVGGCAPTHPDVATTVVRLRQLHNATDVDLNTSAKSATDASAGNVACKVAWQGTITMEPEAPPATPARVPARLGGGQ